LVRALAEIDNFADKIVRELGIPPCPAILTKLLNEVRQEEPDYAKTSKLFGTDVGLAGAMLKTVNSPLFGLKAKATSVNQALQAESGAIDVDRDELLNRRIASLTMPDSAAHNRSRDTSAGFPTMRRSYRGALVGAITATLAAIPVILLMLLVRTPYQEPAEAHRAESGSAQNQSVALETPREIAPPLSTLDLPEISFRMRLAEPAPLGQPDDGAGAQKSP